MEEKLKWFGWDEHYDKYNIYHHHTCAHRAATCPGPMLMLWHFYSVLGNFRLSKRFEKPRGSQKAQLYKLLLHPHYVSVNGETAVGCAFACTLVANTAPISTPELRSAFKKRMRSWILSKSNSCETILHTRSFWMLTGSITFKIFLQKHTTNCEHVGRISLASFPYGQHLMDFGWLPSQSCGRGFASYLKPISRSSTPNVYL